MAIQTTVGYPTSNMVQGASIEVRPEKHQNLQQSLLHITAAVDEVQRVLARVRGEPWGAQNDSIRTPTMGLAQTLDALPEQITEQAKRLAELVTQLEMTLF